MRIFSTTLRSNPLERMKIFLLLDLQDEGENSTILFTGHRGSGKSTELHNLEQRWRQSYHVIYMEVDKEIDINDVAFTDLYLLVLKYVEVDLRREGIKPNTAIIRDIERWFADVTKETTESVESSVSIIGEASLGMEAPFLAKLMVKLLAQIKGKAENKQTIRQTLERDFSRLKANVNLFLDDSLRRLQTVKPDCKGILLIFDNIDRCPPPVSERLFFEYAAQLQELHCSVIYTVHISMLHSPKGITNYFDQTYIVPMMNVYQFQKDILEVSYQSESLQAVAEIIRRRMAVSEVFEDEADLLELVQASGGHMRHLMRMMQEACLTAIGRGHDKLQKDDLLSAMNELQFDFERQILDQHYPAIAETQITKRVANNEIGQAALFGLSVLEYIEFNSSQRWNYPHPLVKKIEKYQEVLQEKLAADPEHD